MVIVSPVKEARFGIPLTTFTVAYRSIELGNNSLKITSCHMKYGIMLTDKIEIMDIIAILPSIEDMLA